MGSEMRIAKRVFRCALRPTCKVEVPSRGWTSSFGNHPLFGQCSKTASFCKIGTVVRSDPGWIEYSAETGVACKLVMRPKA